MKQWLLIAALALPAAPVSAVDSFEFKQLQQKVDNLQREVQSQRALLEAAQRSASEWPAPLVATTAQPVPLVPRKPDWLVPENWQRLRVGMSELEVIHLLGVPNSVRPLGENRPNAYEVTYAVAVGNTGYFVGNVRFDGGKTVSFEAPALKAEPLR